MDEKMVASGRCIFCGQTMMMEKGMPESEADEEATKGCNCEEGREYRKKMIKKERAMQNTAELFGKSTVTDLLDEAIEAIFMGIIKKITLEIENGIKAAVSINNKGEINVEKTETKKQKLVE